MVGKKATKKANTNVKARTSKAKADDLKGSVMASELKASVGAGEWGKLALYQKVGIVLLVVVIAGLVGWIYEFLVGLIDVGGVYMQGGNLLPWINIYAIGAVLLLPVALKLRRWPWVVFLVSAVVTGVVELVGGWLVYTIGNGVRYWNYDHGVWLVGNINGFVCLLTVTIFGIFALLLTYIILPFCMKLALRWSRRVFLTVAISLFALVMMDECVNLCLKNAGLPNAVDFYQNLGWEYEEF